MIKKIVFILIIIAAVIGAVYYFESRKKLSKSPEQQTTVTTNFHEIGNLVKNNPGLKPNTWYLVYEQPGSASLIKELRFNGQMILQPGQKIEVQGQESGGIINVVSFSALNASNDDLIWVQSPLPNTQIASPIAVSGSARGSWYFEGVFPVRLMDSNNKILGQAQAHAQGSWTTSDYVPFTATITFSKPAIPTGTLVLENDNPSGASANKKTLTIPVQFVPAQQTVKLFYHNPSKDKDASGNVLCSRQGLVAVNRQIPVTNTPIQDTVKLLLAGNLSAAEKAQGISTEFPLSGVGLTSANLSKGVLTLEFADPQNKTSGGSCRAGVLWFQLEATAKQFPGVTTVKFKPDTLFQP